MAINTQTIRIDLNTGRTIPVAFAHQNDTNRQLTFQLYNNGVAFTPSSTTVKFAYKSPIVNGRYSVITGSQMASGTVSGNTVTVTLPAQYTQVSGVGLLTMILTTSGSTLRPVNIKFVCQSSADGDDQILNASDWPEGLYEYMDDWLAENEPTEIANLKSDLIDNGIIDIFEDGTYTNSTWRGITLTWTDNVAHVVGTATGGNYTSPNIFANANGFPTNISAGDIINVNIETTTENVLVDIFSYVNGSLTNEAQIGHTQKYTIPENATGLLIRLLVYNGKTANGDISFTITKSATVKSQETVLPTILPAKDSIVDTIESVLNKYGVAVLGKGTYELNRAINMPDNSIIKGAGEATIIKAATGSDGIVAGANCYIQNVRIHSEDGHTDARGTGSGILVQGNHEYAPLKYNVKIDNVTIDGFALGGIHGIATGTWVADSITASNCRIFNCFAGILAEDYSEFGRYTNILCYNNYIGLLNMSGNNVFVNCSFSNNTVGVYLIGDEETSSNNGHGTLVGCTINHSNNNQGFAVICRGISANGFVFDACQIWYGKIQVETSTGIIFNNCMLGAYDTNTEIINYTTNDLFLMNCLFKVGTTFSGSGGETHTINCFKFDGTPITA